MVIWQFSVINWNWFYFILLLMSITLIIANFSTEYSLRLFQSPNTHTRNICFDRELLDTNKQSLRLPLSFKYFSISICSMEWMLASVIYFTEGTAWCDSSPLCWSNFRSFGNDSQTQPIYVCCISPLFCWPKWQHVSAFN